MIFIAEVAAAVVALAYSSFVSSPTSPLPLYFPTSGPHDIPAPLPLPQLLLFTTFFLCLSILPAALRCSLSPPSPPRPTLWIFLSPCKFSVLAAAIIELLALCPPHYIQLLNDCGIDSPGAVCAVSHFEQFITWEY